MLFYLQDEIWADSSVIVYGRYVPTYEISSVEKQVQHVVNDFQTHGHPNYRAEKKPIVTIHNEKKADIYFYSGDKWGNFEAAAYIKEKNSINFLVFNAKNKADFDKNLAGFYSIVQSYKNLAD